MSVLTQDKVINALVKLGKLMATPTETLENAIFASRNSNAWFTEENVKKSFLSFSKMLNEADLTDWFDQIKFNTEPKKVGLILAGNIPMVGFHDILCVIATGNITLIKLSSSDDKLLRAVITELINIEPALANFLTYVERLTDFDAVIATGSNNSSRYFDYYFSKVPHIIRKNRNSIAIIDGTESKTDLENLGNDIFDYFGLGCRNVSKIYFPEGYDVATFFEGIESHQEVINHHKYNNNYDYNKSIYLVNGAKHFDNGFLLLKEDSNLTSPLAVLFYENYTDIESIEASLMEKENEIQCIVTKATLNIKTSNFGESQAPKLWDYADNVNTIDFLNGLNKNN